ncbi:MAG: nucleotide pyrophosphatase/phosphodiesterase family protein [Planctomycetota bacterium]
MSMRPVMLIDVVGLTAGLLEHAPNLRRLAEAGGMTELAPVFPAVTTTVQASMVTGVGPGRTAETTPDGEGWHGIVGNGWYDRERCEVRFWERSNRLVQAEQVWETAKRRDPSFTSANLFWWYNSYSACDYVVQARPIYKADGRKIPDCYTSPNGLRDELQGKLGRFPLFKFWGPLAGIESTRWIVDAACEVVREKRPTLTLVYLPHLDYGLQQWGPPEVHPGAAAEVAAVDAEAGRLLALAEDLGVRPIVVSEYGIEAVDGDGAIAINRVLREAGLLAVREEDGLEVLDPGASRAFAVADHQVAHVYHEPGLELPNVPHCSRVSLDHPRAGDTVLMADAGYWFTYDYWLDDRRAPDFARTVDIHRKPGYDPRELFSSASKAAVAWKLAKRKLGMRQLLDVVPLDTSLVRGTHGRVGPDVKEHPVMLGAGDGEAQSCTAVRDVVLEAVFS